MAKGLYVHIPFCVRKCRYCDFVSFANADNYADKYLDALEKEAAKYEGMEIDTVFIGGGTPSVLRANQLEQLFDIINSTFNIAKNAEFSIEVNPGTLDADKITAIVNGGVNRVSVGIQSFNDSELTAIGRIHTASQAIRAVEEIHGAGIKNINVDLMTSIPNQTAQSLRKSLETAVSLPITHISAYSLILEEGTPLYDDYESGRLKLVSEDEDRDNFDMLLGFLAERGFDRYEISNFAKAGYECRHNIKYWECREYVGLGLAAHSYLDKKRFYNTSDLNKYLRGGFRSDDIITLSGADLMSEFMMMGLRMTRGVSEAEFLSRFGEKIEIIYGNQIEKFMKLGLMTYKNGRYFLTEKGLDVSTGVMCEFVLD